MPLLELELLNILQDWNNHKIRFQKKTDRPDGIPNELYDFPELKGTRCSIVDYNLTPQNQYTVIFYKQSGHKNWNNPVLKNSELIYHQILHPQVKKINLALRDNYYYENHWTLKQPWILLLLHRPLFSTALPTFGGGLQLPLVCI